MLKRSILTLSCLILVAATAHAQGGCVNSPECPTAVLAFVGLAATAIFQRIKR